jgi:hypothetical protein
LKSLRLNESTRYGTFHHKIALICTVSGNYRFATDFEEIFNGINNLEAFWIFINDIKILMNKALSDIFKS